MSHADMSFLPSPPSRQLSFERKGDAFVISGEVEGTPLRLYSLGDLEVMEKVLRLKAKMAGRAVEGTIGDLLAQQVFDWTLDISGSRVTLSSTVLPKDIVFVSGDVRRIYRSVEGGVAAEVGRACFLTL